MNLFIEKVMTSDSEESLVILLLYLYMYDISCNCALCCLLDIEADHKQIVYNCFFDNHDGEPRQIV